jgi:hypothetical protein
MMHPQPGFHAGFRTLGATWLAADEGELDDALADGQLREIYHAAGES